MIDRDLAPGPSSSSRAPLGSEQLGRKSGWSSRFYGYGAGVAVVAVCVALALAGARVLQIADLVMLFPLGNWWVTSS